MKEKEVDWERLRDFLRLAQKAQKTYKPSESDTDDKGTLSRQTIDLFFKFMTSKTGLFLKGPLIIELAETIDGEFKYPFLPVVNFVGSKLYLIN